MRTVIWSDIRAMARVLSAVEGEDRPKVARDMILRAEAADKYRKRLRRWHIPWGNGSLVQVAASLNVEHQCAIENLEFIRCVMNSVEQLERWIRYKSTLNQRRRKDTSAL